MSMCATAGVAPHLQACSDASSTFDAVVGPASTKAQQQPAECSNPAMTMKIQQLMKMVSGAQQLNDRALLHT
jgi:hypothetical protein